MQSQHDLLELLRAVRKRITDPENWTQGAFARDALGNSLTHSDSVSACRWCLEGALEVTLPRYPRVGRTDVLRTFHRIIPEYYDKYGYNAVFEFNDSSTHSEVLDLLDKVINSVSNELSMD